MAIRLILAAVTVLVVGSAAWGEPGFVWSKTDLGIYDVWTLSVQGDTGPAGWSVDVQFTGSFRQELVNGATHVDSKSEAETLDGTGGYEKETDCWYNDDHWVPVAPEASDLSSTGAIQVKSLGSIPGGTFAQAEIFQFVVINGGAIAYSGVLSYAGSDYAVSGTVSDPIAADFDEDGDVDGTDFLTFAACFNGSLRPPKVDCENLEADLDADSDVDGTDFLTFSACFNGSLKPPKCF